MCLLDRKRVYLGYELSSYMDLDWIVENKTISLEVTNILQEIADKHQFSVDVMHQHKKEVVEELRCLRGTLSDFSFHME